MSDRADAHIHLFEKGFQGSFTGRPGVRIDEAALYASLAKDHGVKQALVVGYEGHAWAAGNNDYIATMADRHNWVRPAAFVHLDSPPDIESLERRRQQRFVGITLYIYGDEAVHALHRIADEMWSWIASHRWIVSVNSRGRDLNAWIPILDRHTELRVIVSHLGLAPRVSKPPTLNEARLALGDLLGLARFPQTGVKLSGFYALTDPAYDYPHRPAWPYVEALAKEFGTKRLCWGSDFTPSLDSFSFPQTFGLFAKMPFLDDDDRARIEGGNLTRLLDQVK